MRPHFDLAGATHVGRRSNNEDQLCVLPELGLYAVADGMGGYEGGEVASALAIEQLHAFVLRNRRDAAGTWPCKEDKKRTFAENLLCAGAMVAHREIAARRKGPLWQMGSTLAAVLIEGARATIAHVGDSRVYLLRAGSLQPLTTDHSMWAEMQAAGLTESSRADFQWKNQITRALGIDGSAKADARTLELLPGDRLLVCSDGLHDPLDDEQLERLLGSGTAQQACQALVQGAYDAGGSDNITAIVLVADDS